MHTLDALGIFNCLHLLYHLANIEAFEQQIWKYPTLIPYLGVSRATSVRIPSPESRLVDREHATFRGYSTVLCIRSRPARTVLLPVVIDKAWSVSLWACVPSSDQREKAKWCVDFRLKFQHKSSDCLANVLQRSNLHFNHNFGVVDGWPVEDGVRPNLDADGYVRTQQIYSLNLSTFLHLHGALKWSQVFRIPY